MKRKGTMVHAADGFQELPPQCTLPAAPPSWIGIWQVTLIVIQICMKGGEKEGWTTGLRAGYVLSYEISGYCEMHRVCFLCREASARKASYPQPHLCFPAAVLSVDLCDCLGLHAAAYQFVQGLAASGDTHNAPLPLHIS